MAVGGSGEVWGLGLEGGDRDFGGAVEAERQAYGADAPVDVELGGADAVMAFGIAPAIGRQGERAQAGNADLAAVGVAGEDEVDERTEVVVGDAVGVVGLVRHEEDGCVGGCGEGGGEVGLLGGEAVDAAKEEVLVVSFEADVLVDEQGQAVGFEVAADDAGADERVVIAEDAVTQGTGEGGEQLGAAGGGGERDGEGHGAAGAEVAGDEDEIGGEGVDLGDDAVEEIVFGELFEMDIGKLDDAEAVEGGGQVAEVEGGMGDGELVAAELVCVEAERGGGGYGAGEELSAGEFGHKFHSSGLRGAGSGLKA